MGEGAVLKRAVLSYACARKRARLHMRTHPHTHAHSIQHVRMACCPYVFNPPLLRRSMTTCCTAPSMPQGEKGNAAYCNGVNGGHTVAQTGT